MKKLVTVILSAAMFGCLVSGSQGSFRPAAAAKKQKEVTMYVKQKSFVYKQTNIYSSIVQKVKAKQKVKVIKVNSKWYKYKKGFIQSKSLTKKKPIVKKVSTKKKEKTSLIGYYTLTFYCPCRKCNGGWTGGKTASGTWAKAGRTIACNSIKLGTKVKIQGHTYIVEDTGGMSNSVIDVFVSSHSYALKKGRIKHIPVYKVK